MSPAESSAAGPLGDHAGSEPGRAGSPEGGTQPDGDDHLRPSPRNDFGAGGAASGRVSTLPHFTADREVRVLSEARRVAREVLAVGAAEADRRGRLPADNLPALADAGLFGLADPASGVSASALAAVHAVLAGACGVTAFVWSQHHSPLRRLATSPNRRLAEQWLPAVRRGAVICGTAFSHLRAPRPALTVEHRGASLRLRGRAPWVSGWGVAEAYLVGGRLPDGSVAWVWLPGDRAGAAVATPLETTVMAAAGTVSLEVDLELPADLLVDVEDAETWAAADAASTRRPSAPALGIVERVVAELAPPHPHAADAAPLVRSLEAGARAIWARSAQPGPDDRAESVLLGLEAAAGLVAARGGRASLAGDLAGRLAREATFYVVQAQTAAGRRATLARLTTRVAATTPTPPSADRGRPVL